MLSHMIASILVKAIFLYILYHLFKMLFKFKSSYDYLKNQSNDLNKKTTQPQNKGDTFEAEFRVIKEKEDTKN